ncbi:MAG: methylenetetrahydrofolate--tRNA-(uracil(54)-C(5))-methyltransferase (FADH(2)-oxidizing) TrmFO [Myxococcales bacterium]|nr:methylenetetrahydrofolate--tRNA-(uracil(54)-C(5))-methyltransferase (FADH(2)-oxidizing) TrmFO [Myxococcales bacterium]
MSFTPEVTVVGAGLAGCEAAWQLARRGIKVALVEMKPARISPAHTTPLCAELVCSNSLRSDDAATPAGLLKAELRRAGSLIIECADATRVPAGEALAVDRHAFARLITTRIALDPLIRLERRALDSFPSGEVIIAGGPLVGAGLAREIRKLAGDRLYFYDAIAPIVEAESIDWDHAFRASRYGKRHVGDGGEGSARGSRARGRGRSATATETRTETRTETETAAEERAEASSCRPLPLAGEGRGEGIAPTDGVEGDYVNCPLTEAQYRAFVAEVRLGRKVLPHSFEEPRYFEGCLPIEVMAERGDDVLAFGPLKPVGLTDPRPGAGRPFAVVQLRAENRWSTSYNLVGFQTRLAWPEQKRIFALIPALARAEFLRYGSIHRNSYLNSPALLDGELRLRARPEIRFAGQITGVEGYIESTAVGLLVARFVAERRAGLAIKPPPVTTALGGLYHHLTRPRQPGEPFAPMNINFGLLPPLEVRASKRDRRALHAERAREAFGLWL